MSNTMKFLLALARVWPIAVTNVRRCGHSAS
jgi:hypothetical protein